MSTVSRPRFIFIFVLVLVTFITLTGSNNTLASPPGDKNPPPEVVYGPAPDSKSAPQPPPPGEVAPGGGAATSPDALTQPLVEDFETGNLNQFTSIVPTCVPGGCGWTAVNTQAHNGAFSAWAPDATDASDQQLMPLRYVTIPASATGARLTFWQRYYLEPDFDGGVLEISTDNGVTWSDVGPEAFSTGGYNTTLILGTANPLTGRQAWSGNHGGAWEFVSVDLMPWAGNNVYIRFREGSDGSIGYSGWWIDDIAVTLATPQPCTTPAWATVAPYPIPIMDNAVVTHNGRIYSFAGVSNGSNVANAYVYDVPSNTWTALTPLPAAREYPVAVSDSRYIYILGGYDGGIVNNTVYRYDPSTNAYATMAPFVTATWTQAAAYFNGKIYRIGGCGVSCGATATVEVYTIATNSWAFTAPLPVAEGFLSAVSYNGYIWVIGGIDGATETAKTYRYDPVANAWNDAAMADLPATRWGMAAAVLDGRIVVGGGYSVGNIVNSALAWDPLANTWNALPNMTLSRGRMNGAALGPAFYVVGGREPGGAFNGNPQVQRYLDVPCNNSCTAASWDVAPPYPQTIARYGFAQANADSIFVIAGVSNGTRVATARHYNAKTNVWSTLAPMPSTAEAPAAAYYDGKVYATQGDMGPGFYIYDIATNAWTTGPSIPGRTNTYGAAAGAQNGRVYIVGGGTAGPSTTVNVYTIATNSWSAGNSAPTAYLLGGYTQYNGYLYLVGSYGASPLDKTGTPASSVLSSYRGDAPEANGLTTMRLDMYNATGVWSIGPIWNPQRADFALATDGTRLFAMGGDLTGGTYFDGSAQIDELNITAWPAGSWVASSPVLPSARQGNQAGFYSTGRAGGEIWSTGGFTPGLGAFLPDHFYRAFACACMAGDKDYVATAGAATIVAGVTNVGSSCDDCIAPITLPFAVKLYNQTFTSVNASSNGNLQFSGADTSWTNTCPPAGSFDNTILAFWDDLETTANAAGCAGYPGGACGIFTGVSGTAPHRTFNIEWRAVYHNNLSNAVHFEVVLYEDASAFDVIYGAGVDGASATVGVQRDAGSQYTQYSCNTAGISNGQKINFTQPPCGDQPICTSPNSIVGSITVEDPAQPIDRLSRSGTASSCGGSTSCATLTGGPFHYDAYNFSNNTGSQQCVQISTNTSCTGNNFIFTGAYLGSFDPSSVCTNWIGDAGSSPNPTQAFSVTVPAGRTFAVVVSEVNSGAGCGLYTVNVAAQSCPSNNLELPVVLYNSHP
jgi:N-acetylneuraminic acid mutarotase